MKKIAALIDFTPTCDVTIAYSIYMAKAIGAEIVLVNIAEDEEGRAAAQNKIAPYKELIETNGVACSLQLSIGSFNAVIDSLLQLIGPQLCISGTHGVHGLKQTLFGAHIVKLAQNVTAPLLVVQDESKLNEGGIKNILFSMGAHTGFEPQIEYAVELAKTLGSKVTIYTIIKSAFDITDELNHNINYAKQLMGEKEVAFEHVIEESNDHSLGYSRQTINYIDNNPFDMMVMASDPSEQNRAFSKADKENLILNTSALPVLCF